MKRSLADDHGIRATLFSAGQNNSVGDDEVILPVLVRFFGALLLIGMLVARAWLLPG